MSRVPLKMPQGVKLVPGFKCTHPGCSKRLYASAPSAARHAAVCIHNPRQRTCATCEHDYPPEDGRACAVGVRETSVQLLRNCIRWEAKNNSCHD